MEEEREGDKKSCSWKALVLILLVLLGLGYGFVYMYRSIGMGHMIDAKNSMAASYMKLMQRYTDDYTKAHGKLPDDKEYIVKGQGNRFEPCELFPEGGDMSYFTDITKGCWAVKFRNGELYESWAAFRPINDDEIVHITRDDQVRAYKSNVIKGDNNVIGHCCAKEPIEYFH